MLTRRCGTRVVDVLAPPTEQPVFKVKADEESAWAVDVGYMWDVCRSHSSLEVTSWIPKSVRSPFVNMTTILQVEQIVDGSIVYVEMVA
jgi:hypothetical protein